MTHHEHHHHHETDKINQLLIEIIAHTHLLSYHTQLAHWHVKGCSFKSTHELLGEHYEQLIEAIDTITEHLRYRHGKLPSTLKLLLSLTQEEECPLEDTGLMLEHVYAKTEELTERFKHAINICGEHNQQAILDILVEQTRALNKMSWFYRSTLEDSCFEVITLGCCDDESCDSDHNEHGCCNHEHEHEHHKNKG